MPQLIPVQAGRRSAPAATVRRISARATLDDPEPALAGAAALALAGDSDWRLWLELYYRCEALIARLDLWLEIGDDPGSLIHRTWPAVWIERHNDPPRIEAQIAEILSDRVGDLAEDLRARDAMFSAEQLAGMYVHLELGEDLRDLVSGSASEPRRTWLRRFYGQSW